MGVGKFSNFYTVQYTIVQYNTLQYIIVSRHQINTCTVLYFSVLYCIKIRKFADNKYVRIVQYTIVQYNTLQYIKLRYSIEAPFVAFNVSDQSSAKVSICTV